MNLWLKPPDLQTLSHMYRHAWHAGLKTTYYLRTLGASNIEKASVAVKKEVRGVTGDAGRATAAAAAANEVGSQIAGAPKKTFSDAEKKACSIEAMRNGEECEACQ